MLEWCRNLQLTHPSLDQYTATTSHAQPQQYRKLHPQSSRNQAASITKQNEKRGIKTHFNRSLRENKHTQTTSEVVARKQLINSSTQTLQVIHYSLLPPPPNSILYTPRNLPLQVHRPKQINTSSHLPYQSHLFNTRTRQHQSKNHHRRETKASYNLAESQQPLTSTHKASDFLFKNAQSIHIPSYPKNEAIPKNRLPHKLYTFCIEESDSIKSPQKSQKPFSQKYKDMLKNVQSELKNYEKKHSQKKFKPIPEPQILLYDRKTIISKHNESNGQSQRQIAIEQSFVIEPSIKQLFFPIRSKVYQGYSLSLRGQLRLGMCVSCKQISITSMSSISAELLIYKQLQSRNLRIETILQLYQSQIDGHSYIFVKEPFTSTLSEYLQYNTQGKVGLGLQMVSLFRELQKYDLYLRMEPRIQDFVVCFNKIKIHNLQMLQFDKQDRLPLHQALSRLVSQMQP